MDPGGPTFLPTEGRGQRIPELLLGPSHTLHQLNGLTVLDIDGGQQLQCVHNVQPYRVGLSPDRQFSAARSPLSWVSRSSTSAGGRWMNPHDAPTAGDPSAARVSSV